ncbi:replication initiator protein [Sigmofec virus UA08Rod_5898]|uniref:Replication initiator protein n=1 Tax=Sigmofec virus UA08Rod_5898 TaxID=2929444 RepID=A0A976N0T7_9VIRU|nr:replication initiator protein [Sigmofec virus UA08Rod_5898]
MSCYHPITAFDLTADFEHGLDRVISFRFPSSDFDKMKRQGRLLQLPCRHCVGCRLQRSREWANRILMEQQYHQDSWFLTLTYDDEHLPRSSPVDYATGEILSVHSTLVKKHLQDFFKRLRFNSNQKIRYYAAGEYGSSTFRPHYHILVFGLKLTDLKVLKKNFAGQEYYISDFISKCWPFGLHVIGRVTWQSAAYVARYTMKKATHGFDKSFYSSASLEPEFQTMSLRPAIGRQFYDDHPEMFDYDFFNLSTPQGGRKIVPPEYFKKLYRSEHPEEYLKRSLDSRVNSELRLHLKLMLTDKDYYDILQDEERRQLSRLSTLTRDDL